jgi:hypothetical protein
MPIFRVLKNGRDAVRICAYFKPMLNSVIELDHYPLPTFDDLSQNWKNCKYFSVVDFKGASLQVQVSKASEVFLTINTHKELYRYKRIIYGWSGAPSEFQRIINQIICYIPHCCVH